MQEQGHIFNNIIDEIFKKIMKKIFLTEVKKLILIGNILFGPKS